MIRISVRGDRRPENAQAVVKQEVCRVLAEAGAIVEEVIVEVVEDIQPEAAGGKERLFFAGE
jgi:hypothetical protein